MKEDEKYLFSRSKGSNYLKKCGIAALANEVFVHSEGIDYMHTQEFSSLISRVLHLSKNDIPLIEEISRDFNALKGLMDELTLSEKQLINLLVLMIETQYIFDGSNQLEFPIIREALSCTREISDATAQQESFCKIAQMLVKFGEFYAAEIVIKEALVCAKENADRENWSHFLSNICAVFLDIANKDSSIRFEQHHCFGIAFGLGWEAKRGVGDDDLLRKIAIEMARRLLPEAKSIASIIKDPGNVDWAILIELAKQGNCDAAFKFRSRMSLKRQVELSTVFAKLGALSHARSTALEINDATLRFEASCGIALALAEQGDVEGAFIEIQRNTDDRSLEEEALVSVSNELTKLDLLTEALKLAKKITGAFSKCLILCSIADKLIRKENFEEALNTINLVHICALSINDETIQESILSKISCLLTAAGKLDGAIEIAQALRESSYRESALKVACIHLASQGQIERAQSIADWFSNYDDRFTHDLLRAHTKHQASIALAAGVDVGDALAPYEGINDWGLLNDFALQLADQGKIDAALTTARRIKELNLRVLTLCEITNSTVYCDKRSSAEVHLAPAERHVWDKSGIWMFILRFHLEFARQGRFDELVDAIPLIDCASMKCSAFIYVSEAFAQEGRINEARSMILEATKWVKEIKDRNYVLQKVLVDDKKAHICAAWARLGQWDEAFKIYPEITNHQFLALHEIACWMVKHGEALEAISLVRKPENLEVLRPNLTEFCVVLAECGRHSDALDFAWEMPDHEERELVLAKISRQLAKKKMVAQAFALCEKITIEDTKRCALSYIVGELSGTSEFEEALTRAQISVQNIGSLNLSIAEALIANGANDTAFQILKETFSLVLTEPNPSQRSSALEQISNMSAKAGEVEFALAVAQKIDVGEGRVNALLCISQKMIETGNHDGASQLHNEALTLSLPETEELQNHVRSVISVRLAEAGMVDEALALAAKISTYKNKRAITLERITTALVLKGKVDFRQTLIGVWASKELKSNDNDHNLLKMAQRLHWLEEIDVEKLEAKLPINRTETKDVTIGQQIWMRKNLDVVRFRNGDLIPEAETTDDWQDAFDRQKPAWCYYNDDPVNGTKYGKLYNWFAVNDPRGLAPQGYHIPTQDDWIQLTDYLGVGAGLQMRYSRGWNNASGLDDPGFSGLPGGCRNDIGNFLDADSYGYWWSSTEHDWSRAFYLSLHDRGVLSEGKSFCFSVRCIKD